MSENACKACNGERWVCENHPDQPWTGDQQCCGGAGSPCKACNDCGPGQVPDMPPGTILRCTVLSDGETIQ